jgi:hypothetical protein
VPAIFERFSKLASRHSRSALRADRLSLIIRTLQHMGLPHPVLSSSPILFIAKLSTSD